VVARCSWFVELGEYRWIITRAEDEAHLPVLGFGDGERPEPDDAGTFVFETSVALPVLAARLVGAAEAERTDGSDDGYAETWGHRFPRAQVEVLRTYLAGQLT
jgi:hypothetical protein